MSKMRRKPTLEQLENAYAAAKVEGTTAEQNAIIDEGLMLDEAEGYVDGMRDEQLAANGIDKSIAKVMTNEETPRCPFCKSVKLEEMPPQNWLRWRCNDCRKHFRAPVKGRAA